MGTGYTASTELDTAEEVYNFLDDLDVDGLSASGTAAPVREIDLEEAHEMLSEYPHKNYRITLNYGEQPTVKATSLVGSMPQLTVKGELEGFESFDEFRDFLENEDMYWR